MNVTTTPATTTSYNMQANTVRWLVNCFIAYWKNQDFANPSRDKNNAEFYAE